MEILITGGTGLIGRTLTSRPVALGHHVTVLTRNPERARARSTPLLRWCRASITSVISIRSTR